MNHLFIQNRDLYSKKEIKSNLKTLRSKDISKFISFLSPKNENPFTQISIGISKVILMQVQSLH